MLHWKFRRDVYQVDDRTFVFRITKENGIYLSGNVEYLNNDGCICSQSLFDFKYFENLTNCEMFLSRKKHQYKITVDCLLFRTYHFR